MINEIGNKYGKLIVVSRGENDNSGKARWNCQCECGNNVLVRGTDLRRGKTTSCGCSSFKQEQSLVGQKFGRLLVIEYVGRSLSNKIKYKCLCDCGNEVIVIGQNLRNGNTKSCGCYKKELNRIKDGKNEIGNIYGNLTVISFFESKNNNLHWRCRCTCGNEIVVNGVDLRSGNTKSCGCIKSFGEQAIKKILIDNHITFKAQFSFDDLIYKSKLKFDFAIIDNNKVVRLIEFDGPQHYDKTNKWYSEENQLRDNIKNMYALSNNYPLVRIPFKEKDNLNLELLFSDKYLVKNF